MTIEIAVTGGTGFVGRHVLSALHDRGLGARVLARQPAALRDGQGNWEIIEGDLHSQTALDQLVAGARTVIHIAGVTAAMNRDEFHKHNATASEHLAGLAAAAGIERFILVSSLAARAPHLSDYAASKNAAEDAITRLDTQMARIIVRPPAVYGPGDQATLPLFQQLSRRHGFIPGTPTGRFSLIHAGDLAQALISLTDDQTPAGTYDLDDATPGGYGWPEIADIAGAVTGQPPRLHFLPRPIVSAAATLAQLKARLTGRPEILGPGKVNELFHPDWVADSTQLMAASTWRPAIGFREGFATTLDWYRAHGQLPATARPTTSQSNSEPGDTTT